LLVRAGKTGLLKRRCMVLKGKFRDSWGRRRDLFYVVGLCFLCVVVGVVVGTWIANSAVYAGDRVSTVGEVEKIHKLPDVGGKGRRAWIEGTKGWDENGNYLYPVESSDSVGIGVTPTAKLDIDGLVRIRGGTPGSNKVLTSDANGLASWEKPSGGIPSGVIVMWSGTLSSIPSGWALCDGTNGTPDLRDRFIYGWSDGVNPGGTGGAVSHSHTVNPHSHGMGNAEVRFGPNEGSRKEANRVTHLYSADNSYIYVCKSDGSWLRYFLSETYEVGGINSQPYLQLQGQSTESSSPGTNAVDHLPPYYKLAFIVKL
jgi:hypothetical protein